MSISKQDLDEARKQVIRLTDKLGNPIDPGILDLVTVLRLLGINTTGSCEGHLGRFTSGPYIMFQSPLAKKLCDEIWEETDSITAKYKKKYQAAEKYNVYELQKMYILLDGFYENRNTPTNHHLIVRCFGASFATLMCQGADLANILAKKEQKDLLEKNQLEMKAFMDYLIKEAPSAPPVGGR